MNKNNLKVVRGNLVDVINEEIYAARIDIEDGKIISIRRLEKEFKKYIIPPLIDSHIHIESTLLSPKRFAEIALLHGTISIISDPHEIANVLGIKGIMYMIEEFGKTPLKAFFTAPSCVPAVDFESSGAKIGVKEIENLMRMNNIVALGEVMNFPAVIRKEKEVMEKIEIAKKYKKPIDGHAPMLRGKDLKKYISVGITTDHECTSLEEAEEKLKFGMKIMIREGSSAKNMKNLIEVTKFYDNSNFFLVSDDINPRDLSIGHVNLLVKKAIAFGIEPIIALKFVSLNPISHYKLPVGCLRVGDYADFVIVNNLKDFKVVETWINGRLITRKGKLLAKIPKTKMIGNTIKMKKVSKNDIRIILDKKEGEDKKAKARVIQLVPEQIVTKIKIEEVEIKKVKEGFEALANEDKDIIKIVLVDRYGNNRISSGFVSGFNLKKGAIASSISHDSHNIISVGSSDSDISLAINEIKRMRGGICIVSNRKILAKLNLPIAGLMSRENFKIVSNMYEKIEKTLQSLGCSLKSPLMQLSFLALPVIPELKITTKGLFDVNKFEFVSLFLE